MTAAVEIRGLVKRYAGRPVLDGIDLAVGRGELVALLGPNGAGKTTCVEIVEGYRTADGGSVRVLGEDPGRGGRALRARIGLMLQTGGVDPRARPLELLRLYAAFFAEPGDPDELLDLVGLRTVAQTPYRRLSGGERQRLSLALALVGRPELLILDEPTAGMDPAARAATRALIEAFRADGAAILLTTHDLVDVERLADRVAVLHRGRIVAEGSPSEIAGGGPPRLGLRIEPAADPATIEALATSLRSRWPEAVVAADPDLGPGGLAILGVPPEPGLVEAVAGWAAADGRLIVTLQAGGSNLEARYLALTGDTAIERTAEPTAGES